MLKLYGGAWSRATIVQWYLEELGVPYEFVLLDLPNGEHRLSDFLAINPFGKVPAIAEGDFHLWESGAILLYLAGKYNKLPDSLEKRSQITQWVLFANSTLGQGVFDEANRERELPKLMTPLDQILNLQSFLVGEFSIADVAVGSLLNYIPLKLKLDLSAYPAVLDYIKRLTERPAFIKVFGGRS